MAIRTDATPCRQPLDISTGCELWWKNFVHTTGHRQQFRMTSYEPKIGVLSCESNEDLLSSERSLAVVLGRVTASIVSAPGREAFF
jgi:hypothetical protein